MRLIDVDELLEHKFKSASERMDLSVEYMGGWNDAIDSIDENAPTIDAVEVIKCKDCKYRLHLGPTEHYPETYICRIDNISGTRKAYRDEWFCADGERRTDENDN